MACTSTATVVGRLRAPQLGIASSASPQPPHGVVESAAAWGAEPEVEGTRACTRAVCVPRRLCAAHPLHCVWHDTSTPRIREIVGLQQPRWELLSEDCQAAAGGSWVIPGTVSLCR